MENRDETVVVEDIEQVEAPPEFSEEEQAAIARGDLVIDVNADVNAASEDVASQPVNKADDLVPRARFNEINERLKTEKFEREQLAAQLRELQARADGEAQHKDDASVLQDAAPNPRDVLKDLRQQSRAALLEGDFDRAEQLDDQIDNLVLQISVEQVRSERNMAVVANSVNEVAAAAIEKYPFLNSGSPDVDVDAVNAVIARREELEEAGYPRPTALQMAVDEKGPKFARINGIGTVVPPADEAARVKAAREKAAREKAAATSVAQPAMMPNKSDKSSFAVDVNNLSAAQMKSLPEEEKARLRGDIL